MQQVSYNCLFIFTSHSCACFQIRICFNSNLCSKVIEFAHANNSPLVSYAAFWQSQRKSDGKPSSGCGYCSGCILCGVISKFTALQNATVLSTGTPLLIQLQTVCTDSLILAAMFAAPCFFTISEIIELNTKLNV